MMSAPSGGGADDNFKNVTLLLNGDGTNGAQNNTFLDSSTNNFTITRNGNTTQGSFSPYGANWSNYFDGTGDYLTAPSNSAWTFGSSGNFTIELWVNVEKIPATAGDLSNIVSNYSDWDSGFSNKWAIGIQRTNKGIFFEANGDKSNTGLSPISLSTWNHVAVVRNGSTVTLYINGVAKTTLSGSPALTSTSTLYIGGGVPNEPAPLTGYISNLRIVKGTAVYTSDFTPSTTPLTAITNTQLLTCQSNRFIDNSSNAFALTVNGNTSIQRFSPFSPTASYDTATIGGSGYFDGSGDYLSVANSPNMQLGSGDFTLECWINPAVATASKVIYNTGANTTGTFDFGIYSGSKLELYNTALVFTSSASISANTWTHIAVTRSGTTLRLFINGTLDTTVTSHSYDYTTANSEYIGSYDGTTNYWNGYISNFRLVKGTAVYTTTFTPPTSPVTAISGTQFLGNMTNAGIPDSAMMNDLETVGNAQVSTSVKKYGTGSIAFDGSGDYLTAKTPVYMGTGNFTVEFWYYPTGFNSYQDFFLDSVQIDAEPKSFKFGNTFGVYIYYNAAVGEYRFTTSNPFTTNTWQHVAFVKQGTTIYFYLNGVSTGTPQTVSQSFNYKGLQISKDGVASLTGYIDDFRLTSGVARYPNGTTFTAPTAALPTK